MTRGAVLYLNKALPMNLVLEDSSTDGHLCACLLTLVKRLLADSARLTFSVQEYTCVLNISRTNSYYERI